MKYSLFITLSYITDAFLMSELNITVRKAGKKGAVHMYKEGEKKGKEKKGRKKIYLTSIHLTLLPTLR